MGRKSELYYHGKIKDKKKKVERTQKALAALRGLKSQKSAKNQMLPGTSSMNENDRDTSYTNKRDSPASLSVGEKGETRLAKKLIATQELDDSASRMDVEKSRKKSSVLKGNPNTSADNIEDSVQNRDSASGGNEITVFCPKCNTEVPHTAEGIQEERINILVAKVYHYFEQEYEELKKMYGDLDLTTLSRFRQRTALATEVSETTVLQILDEEQGRNADKQHEPPKKRRIAPKRSRQTDSSSEEDSSDDNDDDGGRASVAQLAQYEPEIETLVVKIEPPEYYMEQPQTDPILVEVKAEPPDEDVNKSGLLGATEVKLENIEIGEEGFS